MTSIIKIIVATAAVAGSVLSLGPHGAQAIEVQSGPPPAPAPAYKPSPAHGKQPERIVRDHRANPTTWNLPPHYHHHNTGQGQAALTG